MPKGLSDGSHPSQTVLAYFAGILDGEGNVSIERVAPNAKQRTHNPRHQARVTVVNTSPELIEWLVAHFGGTVQARKIDPLKHKQTWAWRLAEIPVLALLKLTLPYLVIKRRQAELVIEFVEGRVNFRGYKMITPEELARRDRLWNEIKRLNKMGVAPAETKRGDSV
jgi:hypothetical protein